MKWRPYFNIIYSQTLQTIGDGAQPLICPGDVWINKDDRFEIRLSNAVDSYEEKIQRATRVSVLVVNYVLNYVLIFQFVFNVWFVYAVTGSWYLINTQYRMCVVTHIIP